MKKNKKLFKIILIVIDIIAIVGLVLITTKWIDNNVKKQEIVFKHFTFYIPKKIHYEENTEFAFILETADYVANIKVYLDSDNSVFSDVQGFQYWLLAQGIHVDQFSEEKILDNDVLMFPKYEGNDNSTLCYFKTGYAYLIEVKLQIKNEETNSKEALSEIIDIFNNATYNPEGEHYYLVHDFSLDDHEYFKDLQEVSQ